MSGHTRLLAGALILWLIGMSLLARWGLPSRASDATLFGGRPPWPAERYQAAAALQERTARGLGADVDLNPLVAAAAPVDLTASPAQRAEILRRYRLFTRQPDEMITLLALQRMDPRAGDFDPRLYQYGGAWIYSVGAALGVAHLVGWIDLGAPVDVYLQAPERFARFYFAARTLCLLSALAALFAVWRLASRLGGPWGGWTAVLLLMLTPAFLSGALEAKPHVPSAAALLWSIDRADAYLRGGRRRDALLSGGLAGLAFGLVLTGLVGALTIAAMLLLGPDRLRRRSTDAGFAALLFAATYALTNPYPVYHAIADPEALQSNLANSTAMYSLGRLLAGFTNVAELLLESAGPAALGLLALVPLARRNAHRTALLAAAPTGLLLLCIALGAGKPPEFARFLVLPVAGLSLALGAALPLLLGRTVHRAVALGLLLVVSAWHAAPYLRAFLVDAGETAEPRRRVAQILEALAAPGDAVGVLREPAPYGVPPIDFAHRRVLLIPAGGSEAPPPSPAGLPEWVVMVVDDLQRWNRTAWRAHYTLRAAIPEIPSGEDRITWAGKGALLFERIE